MKEEQNTSLESIRRGIWCVLGVLLLMFGFDHTPIAKSDAGGLIVILGLVTGILMIIFIVGSMIFRFLMRLVKLADEEKNG